MTADRDELVKRIRQAESEMAESLGSLFEHLRDKGIVVEGMSFDWNIKPVQGSKPQSWTISVDLRLSASTS